LSRILTALYERNRIVRLVLLPVACLFAFVATAAAQFPDWPGGGEPQLEPALFAPGLVNAGAPVRDVAISPDRREIYFGVQVGEHALSSIAVLRWRDGAWTGPELLPFATNPDYTCMEPALSPDGRRLFYATDRPHAGDGPAREDHDIWVAEREGDDWGAPRPVPGGVNSDQPDFYPSCTNDGTLYFTRDDPATGASFLYRARPAGDAWAAAELLPEAAQLGRTRFNASVAPDESWLIVPAFGLADSRGGVDYYLLRRSADDVWSEPLHLAAISSEGRREWSATVSPDGSALFFMSDRHDLRDRAGDTLTWNSMQELQISPPNGSTAIWWIDASFLDNMMD
jgi:hypothetical protein